MIVSKATSVYVIMVVVLFGGLWLILAMGSTLIPPTDLGGKWELSGASGSKNLSVEQSGKFVDLAMGNWTASLKIDEDANQSSKGKNAIVMTGKGQRVAFEGLGIDDLCSIKFDGPMSGVYQAHRIVKAAR
jgi:hypothetical protein